jgi:Domain of unknown function (DUF4260)
VQHTPTLTHSQTPPATAHRLAWLAHIAIDRAAGFGLRTRQGFQRG